MKMSHRSTYGLRAMMAVAADSANGLLMAKTIAARHHLPATYLEQIMVPLRKAGLLLATRGAHGGYRLARPAHTITVREILEILEGALTLTDELDGEHGSVHVPGCAVRDVLTDASAAMQQVFAGVTLADLVERQQVHDAADTPLMYMI